MGCEVPGPLLPWCASCPNVSLGPDDWYPCRPWPTMEFIGNINDLYDVTDTRDNNGNAQHDDGPGWRCRLDPPGERNDDLWYASADWFCSDDCEPVGGVYVEVSAPSRELAIRLLRAAVVAVTTEIGQSPESSLLDNGKEEA